MPPKPWETRKKPTENISEIIQSTAPVKEDTPKLSANPSMQTLQEKNLNSESTGLAGSTGSTGSYGGQGGYGGYGGGMSSYGGYGSYGGGMYGGGMYGGGYGRYGMMGGNNQKGFLFKTMITLDSFGYLIQTLSEIGRSVDHNCEGLYVFYNAFRNLISRTQEGSKKAAKWVLRKIKGMFQWIWMLIVGNILGKKDLKSKYKVVKLLISLAIIVFAISLYPLLSKALQPV